MVYSQLQLPKQILSAGVLYNSTVAMGHGSGSSQSLQPAKTATATNIKMNLPTIH